jgi:hypothetical protein
MVTPLSSAHAVMSYAMPLLHFTAHCPRSNSLRRYHASKLIAAEQPDAATLSLAGLR